jgi:signal transduction histidine kinase/CheY-like chemotaxis protein
MADLKPFSAWRSVRWKAAGLLAATLLLLAAAVLFEREVTQSITAAGERSGIARMQAGAAQQVLSAAQDAETGQRGFLLTGRAYYLEPYQHAAARVSSLLDRLDELGKDTPWLRDEAAPLRELVPRKLAELEQTVALARAGKGQEAVDLVLTDDGKALMDDIRVTVQRIMDRAEAERVAEVASALARQHLASLGMQAAAALGVLLLGLAVLALLLGRARLLETRRRELLSTAQLEAAVEHIRDGVAVFDPEDCLLLRNSRFAGTIGLPPEAVRPGVPLSDLAAAQRLEPPLLSAPRPGDTPAIAETEQDGRRLEVWRSAMPDGGQMIAVADITRRVQAESLARHAQKMEVLGQMTGGVAHDFNNLLQVVSTNLELVSKHLAKRDGAKQDGTGLDEGDGWLHARLDAARAGAARGARLTRHLLAFARRQPLAPEPLDPARVLMGIEDMLRRTLGEAVAMELVVGGGLWAVRADPNQLENALLNLVVNARDAMAGPGGETQGRLTIEVANASLDEEYAARAAEVTPGQYVMFAVTDTGCGMTSEQLRRATEPFYTTKEEGKGTGLGLSMVFGFAKQSDGHFQLYSELGHGTTARLYIPRTAAAVRAPSPEPVAMAPGQGELVLLVEDDAAVRQVASDALGSLGYAVLAAEDAEAALRMLEGGARPDVLFTDVVMPGPLTSRGLAEQAQRMLPGLAVLFTSGYTQNSIVHNGELDPGISLLSKPWRTEDLARRLRTALGQARKPRTPEALRVLLVEDETLVRMTTATMLADLGHDVLEAETGAEALARLAQGIDLVVCDLGLPDIDGLALVGRIRERLPGIPVVVASGAARIGGEGIVWLGKPYDEMALRSALDEARAACAV